VGEHAVAAADAGALDAVHPGAVPAEAVLEADPALAAGAPLTSRRKPRWRAMTRLTAGASSGASGGLPTMT
jgi:hypothetical protein